MAFDPRDLSILAYANGFTLWHYRTQDAAAQISGKGYFDAASELVEAGDIILAHLGAGGQRAKAAMLLVERNGDGRVALADITGATNGKARRAA
ncbi:MAG: hypothetical protein QNJ94_17080 [Alphaproteobacteria bacterium]|nr:hypothetical protein [Alphaproteobacteria bacterium]